MTPAVTPADIDVDALVAELEDWVRIESPTTDAIGVNAMADRVETFARAAGLDTRRYPGTLGFGDALWVGSPRSDGSNAKALLVLAHLDTVHAKGVINERLKLRREGDRIYGPGIYDMKSGALMAIVALKTALAKGALPRPVDILFVPDEEVGSPSSRGLIEAHAAHAAAALVVEPARDGGKIVIARKGVAMFDVAVFGRAAHAGTHPHLGASAIREAARLILEIETLNDPLTGVSATVGTIRGGSGRNTVPAECRFEVDLRLPNAALADEAMARIAALKPSQPEIRLEITGGMSRPPFAQSGAGARLFDRAKALAAPLGITLEGVVTGGGSDGNFTAAQGVPTLDGLGADGAGAHTFDEHILISSLAPRTALLANLMLALHADI